MDETRAVADLRLHPDAGIVPAMSEDEDDALVRDVTERGIVTPLDITDAGVVLDGRHRLRVARALGIEAVPVRVVAPNDERDYMIRAALLRRHLSIGQRRDLAASLLRQEPAQSDRKVAATVGISRPTVAAVRDELEATGQVAETATRTGTDGKQYPPSQPPRPEPEPRIDQTPEWRRAAESIEADPAVHAATVAHDWAKRLRVLGDTVRGMDPNTWAAQLSAEDLDNFQVDLNSIDRWLTAWRAALKRPLRVVKGARA